MKLSVNLQRMSKKASLNSQMLPPQLLRALWWVISLKSPPHHWSSATSILETHAAPPDMMLKLLKNWQCLYPKLVLTNTILWSNTTASRATRSQLNLSWRRRIARMASKVLWRSASRSPRESGLAVNTTCNPSLTASEGLHMTTAD